MQAARVSAMCFPGRRKPRQRGEQAEKPQIEYKERMNTIKYPSMAAENKHATHRCRAGSGNLTKEDIFKMKNITLISNIHTKVYIEYNG